MIDYIYAGVIVFFLIILLVVAKVEDGEDMEHLDDEEMSTILPKQKSRLVLYQGIFGKKLILSFQ